MRANVLLAAALAASIIVTGCSSREASSSVAASSPSAAPTGLPSTGTPAPSGLSPSDAASPVPSQASIPPGATLNQVWATISLTNVTTGQSFRIADLVASGTVVFLQTMAIWCSSCKAQQIEATAAFEGLDPARVAWIAIDVESSETGEALAQYRDTNAFPFTYAVADAAMARALVADFGETVLNPPSVNIVVIGADGGVNHLRGHRSAEEIHRLAIDRAP